MKIRTKSLSTCMCAKMCMHEYGCVFTGVHLSAHVESGCAFWEYMGIQMCVIISECMCEWRCIGILG